MGKRPHRLESAYHSDQLYTPSSGCHNAPDVEWELLETKKHLHGPPRSISTSALQTRRCSLLPGSHRDTRPSCTRCCWEPLLLHWCPVGDSGPSVTPWCWSVKLDDQKPLINGQSRSRFNSKTTVQIGMRFKVVKNKDKRAIVMEITWTTYLSSSRRDIKERN